jgi:hypothetical protein
VAVDNPEIPRKTGITAMARNRSNPVAGQPSGKVENSRCTRGPVLRLLVIADSRNPKKRIS